MDIGALILKHLLDLYNLGTNLFTRLMLNYAQSNPKVYAAIQALGSAFNMLVGITVLYIIMKLFSKLEKLILAAIIVGWAIFALLVVGLLNPHTAQQVAALIEKTVATINQTLTTTPK